MARRRRITSGLGRVRGAVTRCAGCTWQGIGVAVIHRRSWHIFVGVLFCRQVRVGQLHGDCEPLHRQGMTTFTQLASAPSDPPEPFTDRLRLAVAACLARFKGSSRQHTESDLRCYLCWCAERGLDPLAARRPHLELYIRWM
jgi:hypothetical protein